MSKKESERLVLLEEIEKGRVGVFEAAELLGLSERQVYRLLKRKRAEGLSGIIHGLRGRSSNRGYSKELREEVLVLHRKKYWDYGATLFSEMLFEERGLKIDHETLRRWIRETGSGYIPRRKLRPHRRKRERKGGYGEMIQFDGSYHRWFEARGPEVCLLNLIDDCTGRVYLRFATSENTEDVMKMLRSYFTEIGIPRSIYTDRAAVYKGEAKLSEFGRAMQELGVRTIYAKSPQAKGRVERANRTFQDRLIKALRQRGISTIAEANRYLEKEFTHSFNEKFSVSPDAPNYHRSSEGLDLDSIFCFKKVRQVRNDYTINLEGGYVQLLTGENALPAPKQSVTVCVSFNGEIMIFYNGNKLNYSIISDKPDKNGYIIRPAPKNHPFRAKNSMLANKAVG